MSGRFSRYVLGIGIVGMLAGSAAARDLHYAIPAGKRTLVSSHAVYDFEACTFGEIPVGKLVTPPRAGRVDMVEERRVIDAGRCGRIQGWARNVYYTPAPGFRGTDFLRVDFQRNLFTDAPALISDTDNITLTVR